MPLKIVRNDLTKMQVDAIVNPANGAPIYSYGLDTAVYKEAGEADLLEARREIGYLEEGDVAITPGFRLPAKYIIHAVSPYYGRGGLGVEKKLRSCYRKSMKLAAECGCKSLAFPLLATGSFGYPKEEGMRIALDEINAFLLKHDMLIYLVVFDTISTKLGFQLYPALEAYIDHNYVCDKREEEYGDRYFGSVPAGAPGYDAYKQTRENLERALRRPDRDSAAAADAEEILANLEEEEICGYAPMPCVSKAGSPMDFSSFLEDNESEIKERMRHMEDTFQEYLMYLIKTKGLSNSTVYNRAMVTKQLFSKIKKNPDYHPDKTTALRLCVGAGLNLDETKDLLARAGYALSPSDKRDIIYSFFIEHEVFDIWEIDIALEEFGLPCYVK